MRVLLAILTISAALCSAGAHAWNARGHMMVAAIAWDILDEDVREHATELIKLNPHYASLVAGASPEDRDKVAFVRAATWPDIIKSAPGYTNERLDESPCPRCNTGYDDKLQHRYWHYKDLPFSPDGTPLQLPEAPNAQTQIETFRATLASDANDDIKSYDLVWLLHLVGDVHQPLHATQRFTAAQTGGDRGGNEVQLCDPTCNTTLHSFWDEAAGSRSNPVSAIAAAALLPDPPITAAAITDVGKWIEESFKIAKEAVYKSPVGVGDGPFTVTDAYRESARETAERRIALAGARLGKLLNDHLVASPRPFEAGLAPAARPLDSPAPRPRLRLPAMLER
jgi:S1/P1 Nuclease